MLKLHELDEFAQFLVKSGYLTIDNGQLSMQPSPNCNQSYEYLKNQFMELKKTKRKV